MGRLWKKMARWFYFYGEKYAEMKSVRGVFEGLVPSKLKLRVGKK